VKALVTIHDVAKEAGVAISSVSRVLNGSKNVGRDIQEKVQHAVEALGYECNPLARALKSRKSNTIGVILTDITSAFFPLVLKGIEDAMHKSGYHILFCSTNRSEKKEIDYFKIFRGRYVDGLIINSVMDAEKLEAYAALTAAQPGGGIPIVSLERKLPLTGRDADAVLIPNTAMSFQITRHLLELGRRRIVCITGDMRVPMSHERLAGYKQALTQYGVEIRGQWIKEGDFTPIQGYRLTKELLLQEGGKFDAMV
jgi:LacI family transcriptional regulator